MANGRDKCERLCGRDCMGEISGRDYVRETVWERLCGGDK